MDFFDKMDKKEETQVTNNVVTAVATALGATFGLLSLVLSPLSTLLRTILPALVLMLGWYMAIPFVGRWQGHVAEFDLLPAWGLCIIIASLGRLIFGPSRTAANDNITPDAK